MCEDCGYVEATSSGLELRNSLVPTVQYRVCQYEFGDWIPENWDKIRWASNHSEAKTGSAMGGVPAGMQFIQVKCDTIWQYMDGPHR